MPKPLALFLHCIQQKPDWLGNTRPWERKDKKQRIRCFTSSGHNSASVTVTALSFSFPESVISLKTPIPPLFSLEALENSGRVWGRCPTPHLCLGCPRGLKGMCGFCWARRAVLLSGGSPVATMRKKTKETEKKVQPYDKTRRGPYGETRHKALGREPRGWQEGRSGEQGPS